MRSNSHVQTDLLQIAHIVEAQVSWGRRTHGKPIGCRIKKSQSPRMKKMLDSDKKKTPTSVLEDLRSRRGVIHRQEDVA